MKKFNIISLLSFSLISSILFTSCNKNIDLIDLKKDFAITELNKTNYDYSKIVFDENVIIDGDYYVKDNRYISILNGTVVNGPLYQNNFEGLTLYKNKGGYYDSFGQKLPFNDIYDGYKDYLIVAKNSPFYKRFVSSDYNSDLVILERYNFNNEFSLYKSLNDTHFNAKNITNFNINLSNTFICNDINDIEVISDHEILVNKDNLVYRASFDNINTNLENDCKVKLSKIDLNNLYFEYINVALKDSKSFIYRIKEAKDDFDFILDGEKYNCEVSIGDKTKKVDFILDKNTVKVSKEGSSFKAIGKQILEDKSLSKENYTYIIDNKLNIFKEEGFKEIENYQLNIEVIELKENETLLYLNNELAFIKVDGDNKYCYIKTKNNITKTNYFNLISNNSISNKLYLADDNNQLYSFNVIDKKIIDKNINIKNIKYIDQERMIYLNENRLFIGDDFICDANIYEYNLYNSKVFDKENIYFTFTYKNNYTDQERILFVFK